MAYLSYIGVFVLGIILSKIIKNYLAKNYYINIKIDKTIFLELILCTAFIINIYLFGLTYKFIEICCFSVCIITIATIDFYLKIIPNKIVFLFAITNLLFVLLNYIIYSENMFIYICGIFSASAVLFIVSFFSNGSIGGGDIKFVAASGLLLGWKLSITGLFVSLLIAGFILLALLLLKRIDSATLVPLGPFLAIGMYISILLV